jgi:hypothetical protein
VRKLTRKGRLFDFDKIDPPALELDVYISEDHMEKLIVYKDDIPDIVANRFCKKYNLSEEKRSLLLTVIKEQVSKVLTCISEEEEDVEYSNQTKKIGLIL